LQVFRFVPETCYETFQGWESTNSGIQYHKKWRKRVTRMEEVKTPVTRPVSKRTS